MGGVFYDNEIEIKKIPKRKEINRTKCNANRKKINYTIEIRWFEKEITVQKNFSIIPIKMRLSITIRVIMVCLYVFYMQ